MKITPCNGNGQGTCLRCGDITWMTLLYKIENVPGLYCSKCVRDMNLLIKDLVEFDYNITKTQFTPEIDKIIGLSYKVGYCDALLKYVENIPDREFIKSYKKKLSEQGIELICKELRNETINKRKEK
jgi:hypothetical protein